MDPTDQERFQANYLWFNQFFDDLHQLLDTIAKALVKEFAWEHESSAWYYGKALYKPSLPPYYVTALRSSNCALQVYAVLDPTLMEHQTAFKNEPSLVIVKHSRSDRVLWLENYGLRVIWNSQISQTWFNKKVITGEILVGEGQGTRYYAFQVPLVVFAPGTDTKAQIRKEIVEVLGELPDW
jgi:hypothetical protein